MICYRCGQDVGDAKRCPNCGAEIRPHHVCPNCGFYNGKKVKDVKVSEAE